MAKLNLIKEAVRDWREAKISDAEAMLIISVILSLQKPTKDAIDWAKQAVLQDEHSNLL